MDEETIRALSRMALERIAIMRGEPLPEPCMVTLLDKLIDLEFMDYGKNRTRLPFLQHEGPWQGRGPE